MRFSIIVAAIVFPLAALVSVAASALLVSRLERLAGRVQLTEAMLGLVVALAADSPEITSAITASAHGQGDIGAGVVLGSNVFNLAALMGLGAIVAGRVHLHRKVVALDGATAMWVALLSLVVVATGIGGGAGLALALVVVAPYVVVSGCSSATLLRLRVPERAVAWVCSAVAEEELEIAVAKSHVPSTRRDMAITLSSLVVVVGASAVMERSVSVIGSHFHLSGLIVGGVILAAVTSLPNAVGAVFLAVRGRGAAVLSEAMNSNMLNVLIGLFLPGLFLGLSGTGGGATLVAGWYICLTVLSLALAYLGRGLGKREGFVIVGGYLAFVVVAVTK
jgi:cation:H+ antiporter